MGGDSAKGAAAGRDPAQAHAERRGTTFRARAPEIGRKVVREKIRARFDGGQGPVRGAPERRYPHGPSPTITLMSLWSQEPRLSCSTKGSAILSISCPAPSAQAGPYRKVCKMSYSVVHKHSSGVSDDRRFSG